MIIAVIHIELDDKNQLTCKTTANDLIIIYGLLERAKDVMRDVITKPPQINIPSADEMKFGIKRNQ